MGELTQPMRDAALSEGRILVARCRQCGTEQAFPAPSCFSCGGVDHDVEEHPGGGRVFSWVVNHRAFGYEAETPFTVLLVQLEGGARIYGRLVEENRRSELCGGESVALATDATKAGSYPVFSLKP